MLRWLPVGAAAKCELHDSWLEMMIWRFFLWLFIVLFLRVVVRGADDTLHHTGTAHTTSGYCTRYLDTSHNTIAYIQVDTFCNTIHKTVCSTLCVPLKQVYINYGPKSSRDPRLARCVEPSCHARFRDLCMTVTPADIRRKVNQNSNVKFNEIPFNINLPQS